MKGDFNKLGRRVPNKCSTSFLRHLDRELLRKKNRQKIFKTNCRIFKVSEEINRYFGILSDFIKGHSTQTLGDFRQRSLGWLDSVYFGGPNLGGTIWGGEVIVAEIWGGIPPQIEDINQKE